MPTILDTVLSIDASGILSEQMSRLAPFLTSDLLEYALYPATTIHDEFYSLGTLNEYASSLTLEHIRALLNVAEHTTDKWDRHGFLSLVIGQITEELIEVTMNLVSSINEDYMERDLLIALAPHLITELAEGIHTHW